MDIPHVGNFSRYGAMLGLEGRPGGEVHYSRPGTGLNSRIAGLLRLFRILGWHGNHSGYIRTPQSKAQAGFLISTEIP
jgi:hypothetical protein